VCARCGDSEYSKTGGELIAAPALLVAHLNTRLEHLLDRELALVGGELYSFGRCGFVDQDLSGATPFRVDAVVELLVRRAPRRRRKGGG
jgi:hypothetical protein